MTTDTTPSGSSPAITISGDPLESLRLATWALAALAATMHAAQQAPLSEALAADPERTAVLAAIGLVDVKADPADQASDAALQLALRLDDGSPRTAAAPHNLLLSSLRQAVRVASGEPLPTWGDHSDEVLLNQGRASARLGALIAGKVVPEMPGLPERLATEGARILDVGTGIGALGIELARNLPQAEVLGIDIAERPLSLSAGEIENAPDVAGRVTVRHQDVVDLADEDAFDLIWCPAVFLGGAVMEAATPRLIAALRTGGSMVLAANPVVHDPLEVAVGRWMAVLSGGSDFDADDAAEALEAAGLHGVRRFPTVPHGPILVAGVK